MGACINSNKARSQYRELNSLIFARREDAGDRAYGLLSLSERTRMSNHLQMS